MKKIILALILCIVTTTGCFVFAGEKRPEMLPVFSKDSKAENKLWVGTFQLVWNEFSENIIKGPVEFRDFKSDIADELNKKEFEKSMLSENSYYTAYGETSLKLKKQIETALKEKFGESSELLKRIDWNDPNKAYLVYAMLKKDFKFNSRFEELKSEKFNNSKEKYKYFGIDKESPSKLYSGVNVLFYRSPFDYAVVLLGKDDNVILYRTDKNSSFKEIYSLIREKESLYDGEKHFVEGDRLKVPYISVKQETDYHQLCNKIIKGTNNLYIAQALQTIDFNLNNTGVKLKSEAALDIKFMSALNPTENIGRNFYFNKPFYLFLIEKDKPVPYYAMRVSDMKLFKYKD